MAEPKRGMDGRTQPERLRWILAEHLGITQQEAASRMGVSPQVVSRAISSESDLHESTVRAWSELASVHPGFVRYGVLPPPPPGGHADTDLLRLLSDLDLAMPTLERLPTPALLRAVYAALLDLGREPEEMARVDAVRDRLHREMAEERGRIAGF